MITRNYAREWKERSRFSILKYNDLNYENAKRLFRTGSLMIYEKIDGMLAALVYSRNTGTCLLQSITGATIHDIPLCHEMKEIFDAQRDVKHVVLIGELVGEERGRILPFNQSMSVIKRWRESDRNAQLIHQYFFDVLYLNGREITDPRESRRLLTTWIYRAITRRDSHIRMPIIREGDVDLAIKMYNELETKKHLGTEGITIRPINSVRYWKVKYLGTVDLVILGFGARNSKLWDQKMVSYLHVAFMIDKNTFLMSSKVGSGFDTAGRRKLFSMLMKDYVQDYGVSVLVKPKRVIEITYTRVFKSQLPMFRWDPLSNQYTEVGKHQGYTFTMPIFYRFRTDKYVTPNDLRLEQIPEHATIQKV